jgi:hypothetical protein
MAHDVFTVFFCGTGSNSYDYRKYESYHQGELVTVLAKHHEGMEFVDWIVVDGPGSGNLQLSQRWVKSTKYAKGLGSALGAGKMDNLNHAMAVFEGEIQLKEEDWTDWMKLNYNLIQKLRGDTVPKVANLVGWSRGGAECILFANMLYKKYPKTVVNIFAFDPVPGGDKLMGAYKGTQTILQKNVQNFIGVYAIDERSTLFSPVLPGVAKGVTNKYVLLMPGKHATLVGNAQWKGEDCVVGPGLVTRHLAEQALTNWGVELRNTLDLTNDAILKIYDEMYSLEDKFKEMHQKVYIGKLSQRTFNPFDKDNWKKGPLGLPKMKFRTVRQIKFGDNWTTIESLVEKGEMGGQLPVFINKHHEEVFKTRYPNLYGYLGMTSFGRGLVAPSSLTALAIRKDYKDAIITCQTLTMKIANQCPEIWKVVSVTF